MENQPLRRQVQEFVAQSRERGISDVKIMEFLGEKGLLHIVNPERYKAPDEGSAEPQTPTAQETQMLTPDQQLTEFRQQQQEQIPEPEKKRQGFFSRVGDRLGERKDRIKEQLDPEVRERVRPPSTVARITGDVIGAGYDVLGEGLVTAARGVGTVADVATAPQRFLARAVGADRELTDKMKPTEALKNLGRFAMDSKVGQAALERLAAGVDKWEEFEEKHPEAARDLQGLGNLISILPVSKAVRAGGREVQRLGVRSEALGKKIGISAAKKVDEQTMTRATELAQPEMTFAVRRDEARRMVEGGVLRQRALDPSQYEQNVAQALARVPNFDPNATTLINLQSADRHIARLAKELDTQLARSNIAFPRREHVAHINRSLDHIKGSPFLVGDAQRSADKIVSAYVRILEKHPSTAAGAMKARREFDQWYKGFRPKGLDASDPRVNANDFVAQEMRRASNDFIASQADNVPVRELLQEQSLLFSAIDNMAPKAAREAGSALDRISDNVARAVSMRGRFSQTAGTIVGLGGLGAAATFAPVYTAVGGAGLVGYSGYRIAVDPRTHRSLSKTLQQINRVLPDTTGAERALLMETQREIQDLLTITVVGSALGAKVGETPKDDVDE